MLFFLLFLVLVLIDGLVSSGLVLLGFFIGWYLWVENKIYSISKIYKWREGVNVFLGFIVFRVYFDIYFNLIIVSEGGVGVC